MGGLNAIRTQANGHVSGPLNANYRTGTGEFGPLVNATTHRPMLLATMHARRTVGTEYWTLGTEQRALRFAVNPQIQLFPERTRPPRAPTRT